MENKSHALAAGAFLLGVTALLVALAMWLMRDVANTSIYEMVTDDTVTGLQPQAAVRFKGVSVGKVSSISFDPDKRTNVLVRIAVNPSTPITRSTFATLTFQGVTGLSFVQLDDSGDSKDDPPPGPNGGPPRIPLRDNPLGQMTERAAELIKKFESVAGRVDAMLGAENQAAVKAALQNIGVAAKEAGDAAAAVKQLASHTDKTIQAQFGPSKLSIPALAKQANSTLKSIELTSDRAGTAMQSITRTSDDLRRGVQTLTAEGGALDRIGESASTLSTSTLPALSGLADDAAHTTRRLDRAINGLRDNPQALIYGSGALPPGPGEPGFAAPQPSR